MSSVAPSCFTLPPPSQDMTPDDEALMPYSGNLNVLQSSSSAVRGRPLDVPPAPLRVFGSLVVLPPTGTACGSAILSTCTHTNRQVQRDLPLCTNLLTPRPNSPYRLLPSSTTNMGVHDPGLRHTEPNNNRPLLPASHATDFPLASPPNDRNVTVPYTPPHPLSQSPPPSLPPSLPHPRPVYYGGMWLDEQVLLTALAEPNGKLHVIRCCWQEDRSPCHLWIKGEKSSINSHLQQWHGEEPGGDKSEVECCWSNCKTKTLKESITRHIVRMHLGEVWVCQGCQRKSTRHDVHKRHASASRLKACMTSGALATYSAGVVIVDARATLEGGGQVQYADV